MTTAAAEERERVGPYRILRAIGAGGSARIDLARIDRAYGFQRHVVIKRPLEHLRSNAQVSASLRREARIGGQLRHPNLVAILDAGVHDGYDYLALEYVHGAALRAVMQTGSAGEVRELPLGVALAIVCDVARGMHEAHELTDDQGSPLGLVHRDVSPGNVLIGFDGGVKLADFGIAKETRVSTLSGSMHGTVTYMAPEQCQGHAFDRRADVFSLGVILYELVTGTRLFWADNDVASLHRVLSGSVPRPRKVKPQVASALEEIVMTAVAHEASKRFATALELATAVELYAASAGEVLGARWIARSIEEIVGARHAPWIATSGVMAAAAEAIAEEPLAPEEASLVELIVATGAEEPVDPSFGDTGGDTGDDGAIDEAAGIAEASRGSAGRAGHSLASGATSRRRARRLIAGGAGVTLALGAVVALIVGMRSADSPAARSGPVVPASLGSAPGVPNAPTETATPSPKPTSPTNPTNPNSEPAAIEPASPEAAPVASATTTQPPAPAPDPQPADVRVAPAPAPVPPPPSTSATNSKKRRRPLPAKTGARVVAPATPPSAAATPASPAAPPPAMASPTATSPAPTAAAPTTPSPSTSTDAKARNAEPSPPAAASPRDPGAPTKPSNVQWKPTLLLPTDGSAARPPS
jgi:eukaryotic-like serine/threonine-protein kinase